MRLCPFPRIGANWELRNPVGTDAGLVFRTQDCRDERRGGGGEKLIKSTSNFQLISHRPFAVCGFTHVYKPSCNPTRPLDYLLVIQIARQAVCGSASEHNERETERQEVSHMIDTEKPVLSCSGMHVLIHNTVTA